MKPALLVFVLAALTAAGVTAAALADNPPPTTAGATTETIATTDTPTAATTPASTRPRPKPTVARPTRQRRLREGFQIVVTYAPKPNPQIEEWRVPHVRVTLYRGRQRVGSSLTDRAGKTHPIYTPLNRHYTISVVGRYRGQRINLHPPRGFPEIPHSILKNVVFAVQFWMCWNGRYGITYPPDASIPQCSD